MSGTSIALGLVAGIVIGKVIFSFPGPSRAAGRVNDFLSELTDSEIVAGVSGGVDLDKLAAEDDRFEGEEFQ